MVFKKREKVPSNNYCVLCGRYTNDKKYAGDQWANFFYSCNTCQKVWCSDCMGQVSGLGPRKTFKAGKTGKIACPDCGSFVPMLKNPQNLPFIQVKHESEDQLPGTSIKADLSLENKICEMCGQRLRDSANYCDYCGSKL